MSKIPVDANGQKFSALSLSRLEELPTYTNHEKSASYNNIRMIPENTFNSDSDLRLNAKPDKLVTHNLQRKFHSLIPKMETKLNKTSDQNPRILDLRKKLNDITKRQDRNVDKTTKGLINNITQQLSDEKEQDCSGPYSLLFDLQSNPSTSQDSNDSTEDVKWDKIKEDEKGKQYKDFKEKSCEVSSVKVIDRLPNVLNFDGKPMKEFEYSCEKEVSFPCKRTFNTQSRSDLCLHFKPNVQARPLDHLSPSENSSGRANEENSLDDSLGILTPDQMDDICYLENAFSPTVEGLPMFCEGSGDSKCSPDNGDSPSTDKTESNSAASAMFMQNDFNEHDKNSSQLSITPTVPIINVLTSSSSENLNRDVINYKISKTSSLNLKNDYHSVDTLPSYHENHGNSLNEKSSTKDGFDMKIDESGVALIEDELLPSIHSSILEPVSSITDTTVNLELPLDCKHSDNRLSTNRIEQTPSPEDLPLDNSEINGEISTYSNSQFSGSTLHDSQTFSDSKTDYQKSLETSKVSNSFITSITSITSLDGYQGDGEMSRPVSRGGDLSIGLREDMEMDWQNIPVARRADPMTDSDFFTESDADGLDDHMHRGDRKAQVIDGALYGGKNNSNGIAPLIVNRNEDSCMESSGVYTDFENHRSSPVFLNAIDDLSPDGSSPSTHSECSQKNGNLNKINKFFSPSEKMMEDDVNLVSFPVETDTPKSNSKRNSLNNEKENRNNEKLPKEEKRSFILKKYKMPKRDVPSKLKTILANRKTDAENSVQSSPKALKKSDRRESLSKKNNTSEIKNDYKTKNYKDIKSKVDCSFSLQRSQTACSVTTLLSSKSTTSNLKPKSRHMRMRMELGSANGSGKSSLHSSQSDISASSTPLGKPTSRFPLMRSGKKREGSASGGPPPRTAPPSAPQPPAQAKKNGVVQKLASSPVGVRARQPPASPRAPAPRRPTPVCVQRPTTLPTKEPPRVAAVARGKRQSAAATPPRSPAAPPARAPPLASNNEPAAALAHAAKGVEALGVLVQYLVFRLDGLNGGAWRAEAGRWRGLAAAERTSAAKADLDRQHRAQKDFDTIAECLNKISELEREVSAKDELTARLQQAGAAAEARYRTTLQDIAGLATDIKGLKSTIESLKQEVAESRARLHAHGERERALRAQLEAARAELARERDRATCELRAHLEATRGDLETERDSDSCLYEVQNGHCGPEPALPNGSHCDIMLENGFQLNPNAELSKDANELAAEVRSLRAVLELKQAEAASLRSARTELAAERERSVVLEKEAERARHAAEELRERAAARQRDSDRLRDDNRRLREAAARDREHAARLAAQNEELRYKLRQKSQVVSLLAGGGYIERTLRTRTSSADYEIARSPSPPPDSPPSPASSPTPDNPALPAVKGVVEKHDSVSWVLEIEDSPEEVASRLARRSSFRSTSTSSSSGVKRRGGGSPGSGSPAPASPAPNASKLFRPGELDFPPAPPPLKESAGEAIYIYDDRQY